MEQRTRVYIDHDKILNHLINMENRKKEISIKQYQDLSTLGPSPGIMYGSAKVDKIVTHGFHVLDLFYLPLTHQHTNLQSS